MCLCLDLRGGGFGHVLLATSRTAWRLSHRSKDEFQNFTSIYNQEISTMSISKCFCTSFMLCSLSLSAAEPIGVVTAGPELKINGKNVNTSGAPNWPVAAGDEL